MIDETKVQLYRGESNCIFEIEYYVKHGGGVIMWVCFASSRPEILAVANKI